MTYQLIWKNLTNDELTLFYLICAKAKENSSPTINLKMTDYTVELQGTTYQWTKMVMDMMNNIMNIRCYEDLGSGGRQYSNFFNKYRYIKSTKEIYVELSELGIDKVNSILNDVDVEKLKKLNSLKGKYAYRIAQLLLPYNIAGYHEIDIKELKDLLEIPDSYVLKEISRIVFKPAIKEINSSELLENLSYRYFMPYGHTESVIFEWNHFDYDKKSEKNNKERKGEVKPLMDEGFNNLYDL